MFERKNSKKRRAREASEHRIKLADYSRSCSISDRNTQKVATFAYFYNRWPDHHGQIDCC